MERRAKLRDKIFGGKSVLDAEDYAAVAGKAQKMIAEELHVDLQYDLIDLRKEAALSILTILVSLSVYQDTRES